MNLLDLVNSKVKDTAAMLSDPADYLAAITEALNRYSKANPREVAADIPGNATNDLPLPTGWSDGVSTVVAVEYPTGRVPEELIDRRDRRLYRTPAGLQLRLLTVQPTASEMVRLTYSLPHTEATLPPVDQEAVANLAASICCRQLAQLYAATSDSTIQADVVNYRSKSSEFSSLAKALEALYERHIGGSGASVTGAMATAAPAESGRTRLTHGRR